MKGLITVFDYEMDFWSMAGEFKLVFGDLCAEFGKDSSKIMWTIALVYDPESKLFNETLDKRKEIVANIYNTDWYNPIIAQAVKKYVDLTYTAADRLYDTWKTKMEEKDEFLKTLSYEDSHDIIEKLLLSNEKLYDSLERIEKKLMESKATGHIKGGGRRSFLEEEMN